MMSDYACEVWKNKCSGLGHQIVPSLAYPTAWQRAPSTVSSARVFYLCFDSGAWPLGPVPTIWLSIILNCHYPIVITGPSATRRTTFSNPIIPPRQDHRVSVNDVYIRPFTPAHETSSWCELVRKGLGIAHFDVAGRQDIF